jgi:hypothetical protein
MPYAIRIKTGIGAGDFEGMYMVDTSCKNELDYPIRTWETKKLAKEYLKNLHKSENWEIVKLS